MVECPHCHELAAVRPASDRRLYYVCMCTRQPVHAHEYVLEHATLWFDQPPPADAPDWIARGLAFKPGARETADPPRAARQPAPGADPGTDPATDRGADPGGRPEPAPDAGPDPLRPRDTRSPGQPRTPAPDPDPPPGPAPDAGPESPPTADEDADDGRIVGGLFR